MHVGAVLLAASAGRVERVSVHSARRRPSARAAFYLCRRQETGAHGPAGAIVSLQELPDAIRFVAEGAKRG